MIPRVIHQVWLGAEVPDHALASGSSWREHNPEWTYHLWRDQDVYANGDWPLRDLFDRAPEIVPPDAVGQFRADLFRYELLRRAGGFYADCDTLAQRPLDEALDGHELWAAAEDTHWVGNTYLACAPQHPALIALTRRLRAHIYRFPLGTRPNRLTGPKYLTPIWLEFGGHVAESRLWYPYSYRDVINGTVPTKFGDAFAVHEWQHTRDRVKTRARKKPGPSRKLRRRL